MMLKDLLRNSAALKQLVKQILVYAADEDRYVELMVNDFLIDLTEENFPQILNSLEFLPENHHIYFRMDESYFAINKVNRSYRITEPKNLPDLNIIYDMMLEQSRSKMRLILGSFQPLEVCNKLYCSISYTLKELLASYFAQLPPDQNSPVFHMLNDRLQQQRLDLAAFWQVVLGIEPDEIQHLYDARIPQQHYKLRFAELLQFIQLTQQHAFSYSELSRMTWRFCPAQSGQAGENDVYLGVTLYNQVLTGNYWVSRAEAAPQLEAANSARHPGGPELLTAAV